jgi:excinuclease ABC subunit A
VLDLGPEGGVKGGEVIAEGTPEQVAAVERSFTGQYLRETLAKTPVRSELDLPAAKRKPRTRSGGGKRVAADQPDLIAAK